MKFIPRYVVNLTSTRVCSRYIRVLRTVQAKSPGYGTVHTISKHLQLLTDIFFLDNTELAQKNAHLLT